MFKTIGRRYTISHVVSIFDSCSSLISAVSLFRRVYNFWAAFRQDALRRHSIWRQTLIIQRLSLNRSKWPKIECSGENRYPFRRPTVRGYPTAPIGMVPACMQLKPGAAADAGIASDRLTHAAALLESEVREKRLNRSQPDCAFRSCDGGDSLRDGISVTGTWARPILR
jgi:hypothetical protein